MIEFIELLRVPSGEGQGGLLKLRPWQKQFVRDLYAPHDDHGRRRVRRAILSVARKNGKTALIAALVLAHLVGPEAIPNGEIYSAATDREQAGQVFKFARQIVEADPELDADGGGLVTVVPSTKTLVVKSNGSFYRALSAEAGTKHGLNPSVWIYDELAQARDQELYEVMNTSQGARQEPLGIVISTQSPDPEHPLSKLIDDGLVANDNTVLVHLYCASDDAEIMDESAWRLANPALGDFRSVDDLRALAVQAERMKTLEASFRNLYLNQRVDQNSPLIPRSEWKACQVADTEANAATGLLVSGERIYLALDLSGVNDLTSLAGVSAEPKEDRIGAWHWKPGEWLHEHSRRDRVPYDVWARPDEGWLETPPGRAIDYAYVAGRIAHIRDDFEVVGLAYDRWRIEQLLVEFNRIGLDAYIDGKDKPFDGALRLVPWGQGFRDMAPAVEALEASVVHRRFRHNGNPVLGFCFANAIVVSDASGNRKLDKSKTRFRIDGAVSTAMCLGLKAREVTETVESSIYKTRGIRMAG
ncbi:terminase TerL endonuclease subunit [Aminobacter sp. AP02]|uniref:terminase large subunit n=1 Tax=Aminobacter sp. AP02 TaxID=2135737 RepID=UPI000D7B26CC|nr:terminase TerL endonuclease subunit [Aminobacter sp. AP02]PWK65860.1 phage terminase large subunit-like protein [Aminobacter sp. AP02]